MTIAGFAAAHLGERRARVGPGVHLGDDLAADGRRAGERDAVDVGVDERPAGVGAAVDEVEGAGQQLEAASSAAANSAPVHGSSQA